MIESNPCQSSEVFTTALETPYGTFTPRVIVLHRVGVKTTEEVIDVPAEFATRAIALAVAEEAAAPMRA